ncbi:MAG: hypothetical protein MPJ78_20140 [Hyphomicrobiaceae bacterium]|nr:hypothetical protein [Hyphomicrobiaceae bacterium]
MSEQADPSEEDLDELIAQKRPDSDDEIRIVFLGNPESGKSVLAALLKHRLVSSWIPMTNGKMRAAVVRGHETVNEIIGLLRRGRFPLTTLPTDFPKLEVDLEDLRGRASTLRLFMQDMSGEVYRGLFVKESASHKIMLHRMLTGGAEHVVFATKYVIVVDCSVKDRWIEDSASIATLVGNLRYASNRVHGGGNQKMSTRIAIVFTKADRLLPGEREKPADALAREYPDLLNSLERYCEKDSYRFFRMYVSSKEETDDEYEARVRRERAESRKRFKKDYDAQNAQNQKNIEIEKENVFTQAKQEGKSDDDARKAAYAKAERLQKKFDQKFWSTHKSGSPEKKTWIVKQPLDYPGLEYDSLISWLLNTDGVWK